MKIAKKNVHNDEADCCKTGLSGRLELIEKCILYPNSICPNTADDDSVFDVFSFRELDKMFLI